MLAYVEQLWSFSGSCTFESVRQYHFLFHSLRIQKGIDDGALWEQGDSNLERRTLKFKQQQSDYTASKSRFGTGSHNGGQFQNSMSGYSRNHLQNRPNQPIPTCHQWNNGMDCYQAECKFKHVCALCNGNHRARDCRTPRSNKRHPGSEPGAPPAAMTHKTSLGPRR